MARHAGPRARPGRDPGEALRSFAPRLEAAAQLAEAAALEDPNRTRPVLLGGDEPAQPEVAEGGKVLVVAGRGHPDGRRAQTRSGTVPSHVIGQGAARPE